MSAVQQAIAKLNSAIGNLEGSVSGLEGSLAGHQRDMFGGPAVAVEAANTNNIDKDAVLATLDGIIEKAEAVLQESSVNG